MSACFVMPSLKTLRAVYPADEPCTAGLLLAWGLWGLVVGVWLTPVLPTR